MKCEIVFLVLIDGGTYCFSFLRKSFKILCWLRVLNSWHCVNIFQTLLCKCFKLLQFNQNQNAIGGNQLTNHASQALFLYPFLQKKRWVQIDIQEVPLNIRGKKPEQQPTVRVIEDQNRWLRGCGVTILKETQNLTGHSTEQPTLVDSTLSRVFGLGNLQKSFPISTML